ncbi:O-antigen ligase family protein [Priestia aryabhattai]|uniref:O-antigen ligase family protein n=1 Tax=Priestia aryabhattai TaxID=412384 RepID=UPI003A812FBB
MKITRSTIYFTLLFLVIVFVENLFYIKEINNGRYLDISILITVVLFLTTSIIPSGKKHSISIYIYFFLILTLIGLLIAVNRGNDLLEIVGNYRYFLLFILYFPTKKILQDKSKRELFSLLFTLLGVGYAGLNLIQYFLYPKVIFLQGINYAFRGDSVRFYSGFYITVTVIFFLIYYFFNAKNKLLKILCTIALFCNMMYLMEVTLIRNATFSVLFAIFIIILLQKEYKYIWKLTLVLAAASIFFFVFGANLNTLLQSALEDSTGTGAFRVTLYKYVFSNLIYSPIFGYGFISPYSINVPYNIHVDTGFVGFIYEFGLMGLIWAIILLLKFIKLTIKLYKNNNKKSYLYISYILYTIVIALFNCPFNTKELIVYFVIIYSLLENDVKDMENEYKLKNINSYSSI